MRDNPVFAEYLRGAMRAAGIDPDQRGSASELARRAALSETQVSRWLNKGHIPTIENLRKIAPVLHMRMADLLIAAGYLSPTEVEARTTTAEAAIRADPTLPERERRLLLTLLGEVRAQDAEDRPPEPAPPDEPEDMDGDPDRRAAG